MVSGRARGHVVGHLTTLAALISGIVASQSSQLPRIATKVPTGTKPESRVKRFSRWVGNERVTQELYFLPYAELLLTGLGLEPLVLALDGSTVGRGCVALMMSVIYKGRALPIAWLVREGKKGHFPEQMHIELIEQVQDLVRPGVKVVVVGDGEFDGIELQQTLHGEQDEADWFYVCRTALNTTASVEGQDCRLDVMGALLKPGKWVVLQEVYLTAEAYGPVTTICWWGQGYDAPIYLVTNMNDAQQACRYYQKRFRIETFFSDQKSRGFNLQKSHLSDVDRLSRLLMASCLAYIWIVYLGDLCEREGWREVIHRRSRCDLSLFQLGLRLLDYLIDEGLPIPVQFHVTI